MFKFLKSILTVANSKIAVIPEGYLLVPSVPSEAHIQSMCLRFDHSHNVQHDSPIKESYSHFMQRRRFNRSIVLQLFEEATGQGFYRFDTTNWMQPDDYVKLAVGSKAAKSEMPIAARTGREDYEFANPELEQCSFIDGVFHCECVSCGEDVAIEDPLAFNRSMNYCGRSYRCIP